MSSATARKSYPSDLTDAQWAILGAADSCGEARRTAARGSRCGRSSPRCFTSLGAVASGTCCRTNFPQRGLSTRTSPSGARTTVPGKSWSMRCGRRCGRTSGSARERRRGAGSIDSQTVKSAGQPPGDLRRVRQAKKITGRKRHLVVDTLGFAPGGRGNQRGDRRRSRRHAVLGQLTAEKFPRLKVIWTDNKYHNHEAPGMG